MTQERAVLAGGCFWGMQDSFAARRRSIHRVGYSGGDVPNATYRRHGTHAEAIEIVFDPPRLSYRRLLEFFFQVHDPPRVIVRATTRAQAIDRPSSTTSDKQKRIAEDTIADVDASGLWPGEVVAEDFRQSVLGGSGPRASGLPQKNPSGYTCHFIRPDWKLPARKERRSSGVRAPQRGE